MKIAFVFPGQGSQSVGMGSSLRSEFPIAEQIFSKADSILGYSIGKLCAEGPIEDLSLTKNTQPAIYVTSAAVLAVLGEHGIKPEIVAGHSVGEYAAVVASGALDWQSGLRLVQQRAKAMDTAARDNPGIMAAVLGLDYDAVKLVCAETELSGAGIVECANVNSDAQIVISGEKAAVDAASTLASERGAKRVLPLAVSGGFHSRLMSSAAQSMATPIQSAPFNEPKTPLVANVTAEFEHTADDIKKNLVKQIDHSVLWDQSVKKMLTEGVDTFVEVGSGKVLSGLLKRVSTEITIYSTGDSESLAATISALGTKN